MTTAQGVLTVSIKLEVKEMAFLVPILAERILQTIVYENASQMVIACGRLILATYMFRNLVATIWRL
jgi:hypothetical protein